MLDKVALRKTCTKARSSGGHVHYGNAEETSRRLNTFDAHSGKRCFVQCVRIKRMRLVTLNSILAELISGLEGSARIGSVIVECRAVERTIQALMAEVLIDAQVVL